ncbi:unnamed protein product [Peronospora farinosa]|uniref:BZIP domain-containing protein n=1 Tax=Peronospora farinosa TaxID=134698 RepID=A0ABN8BTH2_9STRA|nr:unnamed protein product [Peronospora farinosa]
MAELNYGQMRLAMQTDEAKRARQREHVKNSYYRQQNVMKALRRKVCELEREYSCTIQLKQQLQLREDTGASDSDKTTNDLVEQYMQLSIKKQQLCRENQELALIVAKHATFQFKMQNFLDSKPKLTLEPPPITYSPSRAFQVNEITLESFSVPECHQIALDAYQEIRSFLQSNSYLTSGLELFGWREQRREAPDHVKFTLKKRFPGVNSMEMSARGWRVLSSPRGLMGLYSSTMRLSIKVLQVVDDHNVIMYRVITNTNTMATVQSLFLVTRFHMANGYIILFRSVDHNRLRRIHPDGSIGTWDTQGGGTQVKWLDMFTWTLFEDEPDNGNAVIFSYGGIVYSTPAADTRVWMLEILSLALRWENKVVGPPLMVSG